MQIPYTTENHPETGVYNGKLGIWLFLASEVLLFGGLFSSYILLRVGAIEWPHGAEELSVPLATINTAVLISSSLTMVMAWASLKMDRFPAFRAYLGATILLAIVFLVIKAFEYGDKFAHGHYPSYSTFFATYFVITGLHAVHVICGVVVNGYFWGPGARMWHTERERFINRIEIAGLYWHFVDIVWIFLFPTLYLL